MKDNLSGYNGNKICTFSLNSTVHIIYWICLMWTPIDIINIFTNLNPYIQLNILCHLDKIDQQKNWIYELEKKGKFRIRNEKHFIFHQYYWLAVKSYISTCCLKFESLPQYYKWMVSRFVSWFEEEHHLSFE